MPITKPHTVAVFPRCECCGRLRVDPVSDAPICFRSTSGEVRTISRSQNAQLLRFLWKMRPHCVVVEHMILATGKCFQYSRALDALRNKFGIMIVCEDADKATKPGKYGLYRLSDAVEVWEPETRAELVEA